MNEQQPASPTVAKTWRVQWTDKVREAWTGVNIRTKTIWTDIPDEEWLREEDAKQRLSYWENRGFPQNFRIVEVVK